MVDDGDFSRLTDDELLAILKAKEKDRTWTLRELFEIERRGDEFLSKDPELQDAIKGLWVGITKGISEALAPTLESLKVGADLTRKFSDQFQGMGERFKSNFGLDALNALQKESSAYKNFIEASQISISPDFSKTLLAGSSAFESLLKASQISINPGIGKHINSDLAASSRAIAAMDVSRKAQKNADVFRTFSNNLANARDAVQNRSYFDHLAESVDSASLDLTANDPKVPAALTAPLINKIETEEVAFARNATQSIEENTAETNTHLKALNQTMTTGAIPRWVTYIGIFAGGLAALEGLVIIIWK